MFRKILEWAKLHRVVAAVLVLAFMALAFGGMELTMRPSFCNSCHEMQRVCSSWQIESHSQIGCMDCHAEPGIVGLIKAKVAAVKSPLYHIFASEETIKKELRHHTETPDSACLHCHKGILNVERVVNIRAPHRKHYGLKDADCQNCHRNVGHCGALPEDDQKLHMVLCLGCHEKYKNTSAPQRNKCEGCHVGEREMLLGKGGLEVSDSPSLMPDLSCTDCHTSEDTLKPQEQACVDCHDKTYPAYIKEWQEQVKPVYKDATLKYDEAKRVIKAAPKRTDLLKIFEVGKQNYLIGKHDGSKGAHNADYAVTLLKKAIEKFDQVIAGGQVAAK